MKFKVGKKYLTRDNTVAEIIGRRPIKSSDKYPIDGNILFSDGRSVSSSWSKEGQYHVLLGEHRWDLVAEYEEPAEPPKQKPLTIDDLYETV